MKLKLFASSFLAIFLLFSIISAGSFSMSQDGGSGAPGTEKPLFKNFDKNNGNACYVYKQYVVMTVSSEDVGEDIKIYKRGSGTDLRKECANTKRQTYMTFPNSDANYFFGITGDKFLVDSGTSAGERGLDIVSLTSKKTLYSTSYQGDVKVIGNAIVYDKPSRTKGSLKTCKSAKEWGNQVGWVRPTRIDLTTLKETSAGPLTCVYVE